MADPGGIQANTDIGQSGAPRRIGRDEVEAAIAQAIEQGCTGLVLLGPGAWSGRPASAGPAPGRAVFQVQARTIAMPSFRALRQLRALTVADLAIDEGWATAIVSNLKDLTSLNLSYNRVGDGGAEAITSNLKELVSLNLSDNRIGEAGAMAIASNLKELVSLNLSDNRISEAGATAIASSMKVLTTLNLGNNGIGDAGTTAIASNLKLLVSLSLRACLKSVSRHVKS